MITYLRLVRLPNLLIIILASYLLRCFIIEPYYSDFGIVLQMKEIDFLILVMSIILISAGGYIINDYYDIGIDRINKPKKMVLTINVSGKRAIILYVILCGLGVILGFYSANKAGYLLLGLVHIFTAICLLIYSVTLKRRLIIGNLFISLLSAIVIPVIWLFEYFTLKTNTKTYFESFDLIFVINLFVLGYALFAFLVSLIREIIKDVEDIEGDRKYGCLTFVIKYGVKKTKNIIIFVLILSVSILLYVQYVIFLNDYFFTFLYFISIQILFVIMIFKVYVAKEKRNYKFLSNLSKLIMIIGTLSMLVIYFDLNI